MLTLPNTLGASRGGRGAVAWWSRGGLRPLLKLVNLVDFDELLLQYLPSFLNCATTYLELCLRRRSENMSEYGKLFYGRKS